MEAHCQTSVCARHLQAPPDGHNRGLRPIGAKMQSLGLLRIRFLLKWLFMFGVILLTLASLLPVNRIRVGTQSNTRSTQVAARSKHRILHWLVFGSLSLLLALLGRSFATRLFGLSGVIALGVLIEWCQHLIFGFRLEVWDIKDDTYGSVIGFGIATLALFFASHKTGRRILFSTTTPIRIKPISEAWFQTRSSRIRD